MTPREIVDTFAQLTALCLDALIINYEGTERPTVWTGLFLRPRDGGDPVRFGVLEGLGTFKLHGRGCQFELESGADLDVDWDSEGQAVFDSWHILMYARSVGDEGVDQEALRVAASGDPAITQLAEDLFTWPGGRYNITRDET
ncbi:hypothetical protein [Nocardioides sp. InS609-2]|uniref:DUF6896 domain-containing protein n=1 Tax=Nocardioides sp. InS609-2 TaxID=2760705 RepID=UPI0020C0D85B|nr:hypothetical protein [Nocardioides sp. InS609-2]